MEHNCQCKPHIATYQKKKPRSPNRWIDDVKQNLKHMNTDIDHAAVLARENGDIINQLHFIIINHLMENKEYKYSNARRRYLTSNIKI
jgi:hypothetical protein